MAIDRLDIVIQGAGPYGFRLTGGDGRPLTVTKLRRQSKACDAGLHEGDILLGINGFECRTMSHSSAMALLENAVDRISLSVFRGALDQLDGAFDQAASSLRPLSPGSLPPPILLPPPPAAALGSSGDLVIDQPSFLRQQWPQQKPTSTDAHYPAGDVGPPPVHEVPQPPPPPPPPPPMSQRPFPPVAEPRVLDSCPPQPLPPREAVLPTFRVRPFSADAKQWTPYHQQAAASPAPSPQRQPAPSHGGDQAVVITRTVPESSRPTKWQPTETPILVRSHAEVNLDPEPEMTTTTWPTPPPGRVSLRIEGQTEDVEVIPRWALPLRSEYDWREVYYLGDSDEWELTEDGQYAIHRKKIFADSSFYDEPEHKYPTIEEQIKMARKVAQSLTSPGNVKARGQRMFLHRKEKADHWTSDALGPRKTLRRMAASRAAVAEPYESESELPYYNPAPWSATASRSPWAKAGGGGGGGAVSTNPSFAWKPKPVDTSPSSGNKWQPVRHGEPTPSMPIRHVEPIPLMPKHSGNVPPPQVAFKLAKDLRGMHDKGSRMFAKLRARAAVDETEDYSSEAVQAARGEVMRRIADSYVPPQPATRHDVVVVDSSAEQPASASRLIEMIEKTRSTDVYPAKGGRETTRTVSFTTTKSQAGFKPVRFKAPLVVTAADIAVVAAEQQETEGISDF